MRLSYLTVIFICGSLNKCNLNAKYNDAGNFVIFGGMCFVFFLLFLGQYCFSACLFVALFSNLSCAPWLVLFLELY